MANRHSFTLPRGRFVSGDHIKKRSTDYQGKPIPEDKQKFEIGIAVPKNDPKLPQVFQELAQFIHAEYASAPTVQQRIATWSQTLDGFSGKIDDGDKPNSKGRINENTAGCFVFWFSSSFPVQCCDARMQQIPNTAVKRGDYVFASGNVMSNGLTDHNAGMYLNIEWLLLHTPGDAITGGRSAQDAFAGVDLTGATLPGNPDGASMPAPMQTPMSEAPAPVGGGTEPMGGAGLPGASTASPSTEKAPPHPAILGTGLPGQ